MRKRPRIGITMRLETESRRFYLGRDYSEAIEACGGVPVHLSLIPKPDYVAAALEEVDGILLPGSNTDVDPVYFGEEPHPRLGTVISEKDETDQLVLKEAESRSIPLLGICYGMQALNVFRGGSLVQDIVSQVTDSLNHDQGKPYDRVSHNLNIEGGSILSSLDAVKNARSAVQVNSSHHQALNRVGENLRAVAWASDGVIECIEDTREGRFAMGVQWHPELTFNIDSMSREIFELFVRSCEVDARL